MAGDIPVKIIDGGDRATCPTSKYLEPYNKRKSEVKSSYDTEGVLKQKFESKVKKDVHFRLGMSTSFYDIPDEDWNRIFKKNTKKRKVNTHG